MDKIITPEKPDSLLIEHYLKGNEIALEYIVNKHQQKIFNFIYSKVHDRDISEDIFLHRINMMFFKKNRDKYNNTRKEFLENCSKCSYINKLKNISKF